MCLESQPQFNLCVTLSYYCIDVSGCAIIVTESSGNLNQFGGVTSVTEDLRDWLQKLDQAGQLFRLKTPVDWQSELAEIQRRVMARQGPAMLYENITGYENGRCTRLFCGGLGTLGRIALMLDLPLDTPRQQLVREIRRRLKTPLPPVEVAGGPVKENIVTGGEIDLFQFPIPQWHPLDGGRYINTSCGVVTRKRAVTTWVSTGRCPASVTGSR